MDAEERRIRDLRDLLFRGVITDDKWRLCRENWMKPENVQWLEKKVAELPDRENRIKRLFEEAEKRLLSFS